MKRLILNLEKSSWKVNYEQFGKPPASGGYHLSPKKVIHTVFPIYVKKID